jgi:hypothetical protein
MGSFIELNDTLRITSEQGFPAILGLETHLQKPYVLEDVVGKTFSFRAKPDIRVYKIPPVRNFLVQEINGKWVYWGLCFITSVTHDYIKKETAGTFQIIRLNSPKEMRQVFPLVDTRPELNYFEDV